MEEKQERKAFNRDWKYMVARLIGTYIKRTPKQKIAWLKEQLEDDQKAKDKVGCEYMNSLYAIGLAMQDAEYSYKQLKDIELAERYNRRYLKSIEHVKKSAKRHGYKVVNKFIFKCLTLIQQRKKPNKFKINKVTPYLTKDMVFNFLIQKAGDKMNLGLILSLRQIKKEMDF